MEGLNAHGDNLDLRAVLGALRRRKLVILGTTVLLTGAILLVTLQLTPLYTATSSVMIEPSAIRAVELKAVATDQAGTLPGETSAIATQIKLLRSRALAKEVILALGLDRNPDYNPVLRSREMSVAFKAQRWLVDNWLTVTGFADQLAPRAEHAEISEAARAPRPDGSSTELVIDRFLDRLEVVQEGESRVVTVRFSSASAEEAARIVNTTVERYIQSQLADKLAKTQRAARLVSERARQLRDDVLQAETAVSDYRAANGLMDSRDGSLDAQQLTSLQAALATAQAERAAKEARVNQVHALTIQGQRLDSLSEVETSPIILNLQQQKAELQREEAQLSQVYGEKHPRVIEVRAQRDNIVRRIGQEIGTVVRNLENELAVARMREQALEQALAQAKERYATAGQASVQLRELERVAAAKRLLYETFLARSKEIDEQQELLEPDARVIYSAEPPDKPSFPKLGIMAAAGLVTSLMAGTALAALLEHLDRSLRNGRQVERMLGVPMLGLIPHLGRAARSRGVLRYLLDRPASAYAEAIKELQTTILHPRTDASPRVLLVTSTQPGEGKTTLALSLAASLARSGRRTLVLDLDLRRPNVARTLAQPVGAGVVEFMLEKCSLDESIQEFSDERRLHFISTSSRGRMVNPSDLIGLEKMRLLMTELRQRYSYIILDAPPALGLADVRLAAPLADTAIFVVQWGKTSGTAAVNGLDVLVKSGIPVLGAVINQVDLRRHAKYGYNDIGQSYGRIKHYFIN